MSSEISASSAERMSLLRELVEALRRQSAQSVLLSHAIASKVGINAVDLECLDLLQMYGPMPAGRLAQRAGLSSATMTSVLDRLENAGFVSRRRDGADRRVVTIEMTPAALSAISPHYQPLTARIGTVCAAMPEAELKIARDFACACAAAVEEVIGMLRR